MSLITKVFDTFVSKLKSIANAPASILISSSTNKIDCRPMEKISIAPYEVISQNLTVKIIHDILSDKNASSIFEYFKSYPKLSFMSNECRLVLYQLVRYMNARSVAEIGTLFAGTSEVLSRAIYENGGGVLYTTDPFGGDRCPEIISQWPDELQKICQFSAKNSMDFFLSLENSKITLDICLVDGNHDFGFALFDLNMAAKLLRPGGIVVMDNAEQTGPYYAAKQFLENNPGWAEIGNAIEEFKPSMPFNKYRASVSNTSFLLLRKPEEYIVSAIPISTTQVQVSKSKITGLNFMFSREQCFSGNLHMQIILRAFRDGNKEIEEYVIVEKLLLNSNATFSEVEYIFDQPLISNLEIKKGDCSHTLEIELSWEAFSEPNILKLTSSPSVIF